MANSSNRYRPGDSVPDFSHLNDPVPEVDETEWQVPVTSTPLETEPADQTTAEDPQAKSETVAADPVVEESHLSDADAATSSSTAHGDEDSPAEDTTRPSRDDRAAASSRRSKSKTAPRKPRRSEPQPAESVSPEDNRQRLAWILLISYASAVTLACLWLLISRGMARPHELENLPDVAPLNANEFRYAPQSATMPRGHTLPIGGEQQLGNIRVEPLRVTRGPVAFTHFSDATQSKPPTEPVLKLWLKFTNVSEDQQIAPLDATLLFTRNVDIDTDTVQANQLILSAADKVGQKPAFVLDQPVTSDWDLAGQQLGQRLKPGESLETYIPIDPGSADQLTGDLLWRVHFRKGFNDQTGHGVTTMIEVPFAQSDVESEPSNS